MPNLSPFISLRGQANDAIAFYETALGATCLSRTLYGPDEDGTEGTVRLAVLAVGASQLRIIDVPDLPDFSPSAAVSILLACETASEVDRRAGALAAQGTQMMPADAYPFADRFAWVADRFGIQWQVIFVGTAPYPGTRPG